MRRAALILLLACAALAAQPSGGPLRVLFLVGGDHHDYDRSPREMAAALQARLKDSPRLEFTITKDLGVLRAEELRKFDLLMLNICYQANLDPELKQGLAGAVRAGLPVVALHCTFWCFQNWPEFREMLGAVVPGHAKFGPMCVEVKKPADPVAAGVAPRFDLTDEPYFTNERSESNNVLLETCRTYEGRSSGPEPEVWTRMYGQGRIFAMTFGHDRQAQENPEFQRLLANGVLWALGR